MSGIITYSLKPSTTNSDEYYQTISTFADTWIAQLKHQTANILARFHKYLQDIGISDRSDEEIAFELLALGVYIHEHGDEARGFSKRLKFLLTRLVEAQNRWPKTEALIKVLRGWAYGLSRTPHFNGDSEKVISDLIAWLNANGEEIKADRFTQWHDYFEESNNPAVQDAARVCYELADEFAQASQQILGKYTELVEHFLTTVPSRHRWLYDFSLVSKTRMEYHLGMLGTEILNRAYRQHFLLTEHKVVIVPPCMSAPADKCKATETSLGAKCSACTPSCRVNQITKLGGRHGFEVFMIPDEMRAFSSGNGMLKFGVVGISCALTNWNGGWETDTLGIPAQGVLLDYVGCKFHWDQHGFPTDTNLKKLLAVLGATSQPGK